MSTNRRLRIAVCGIHSLIQYSGGRYYAWMMAEALAYLGHDVTAWTNNIPAFLNDFADLPGHQAIDIQCSPGFREPPEGHFDVIILVPHGAKVAEDLYPKTILLAQRSHARLVLLNFETPNWFNQLSPEPRAPSLWRSWKEISQGADLVLSLSAEGTRFARDFYTSTPAWTLFHHCYPPVNSIVADMVEPLPRERQIICITRFDEGYKHKGGQDLLKAIGPQMAGCTLSIVVGTSTIDPDLEAVLMEKAEQFDVAIRLLYRLSDYEKFQEIKRSPLMLFLSYFEGFGYPPVEAQYCNTPCIVYDLPVLREVSGEGLIYVPPGDEAALQEAIQDVLSGNYRPPTPLSEHIAPVARFENYADGITTILEELMELSDPPGATSESITSLWGDWYWRLDGEAKRLADSLAESRSKYRIVENDRQRLKAELLALQKDPILSPLIRARVSAGRALKRWLPPRMYQHLSRLYGKLRGSSSSRPEGC